MTGSWQATFARTLKTCNTSRTEKIAEKGIAIVKLVAEPESSDSDFYFSNWVGRVIVYMKGNLGQLQTGRKDEKAIASLGKNVNSIWPGVWNQSQGHQLLKRKAL